MEDSNHIGRKTEAIILSELVKAGMTVALPWGGAHRYDFLVDWAGSLFRVQCKTAHVQDGAVRIRAKSYTHGKGNRPYLPDEVDVFVVWCPETEKVYWLLPEILGDKGNLALRVTPSKNNQVEGIRWAETYELGASLDQTSAPIFVEDGMGRRSEVRA